MTANTVAELKARRSELMAKLKNEQALQDVGLGDDLALFIVKEELITVNAQLRMMTPGHRVGGKHNRVISNDVALGNANYQDRKQFLDWFREEGSLDDEIEEGRSYMKAAVVAGLNSLSPKQRDLLMRWINGDTITEMAAHYGVNQTTVSRNLKRAKAAAAKIAEPRLLIAQKRQGGTIDMSDPAIASLILNVLTDKQAVNIYLYFGEWLSLREISDLLGLSTSTIHRTIWRGIARIQDVLGEDITKIENAHILDDLGFAIYCKMEDLDHESDEYEKAVYGILEKRYCLKARQWRKPEWRQYSNVFVRQDATFQVHSLLGTRYRRGHVPQGKHGRLFLAILDKCERMAGSDPNTAKYKLYRWLTTIFGKLILMEGARKNNRL